MTLTSISNRIAYGVWLLIWPLRRCGLGWDRRTAISVAIWWLGLAGLYRIVQLAPATSYNRLTVSSRLGGGTAAATSRPSANLAVADPSVLILPPGRAAIATSPIKLNNSYAWGQCTSYVASRRPVPPHWGNASSWLSSAQRAGWATGTTPQRGAIAWTAAGRLGHVALVESVSGGQVLVSEMNYVGLGRTDQRWSPSSSFRYIY